ncbi:TIGR03617 family F420-dependent LLM class oxidoreductase [Natronomonas marina]|jgi:probable F420-dependent oxidoreductase|uniref:TIGR03617 family F420-dependent LLM class oxidoreductase n=1 Tax=Natronomonas marina TaxID=2961939 RepID=UPI0020C9E16C|nr:TIGR03617 family F420-dependent LLM class oxidoreductase [Natronomonas marina]
MKIDTTLGDVPLNRVGELSKAAEETGFDGIWLTEIENNPFSTMALALEATSTVEVGSAIALAFPRSPMVTAYSAWNLQSDYGGRFTLGLGTQVKAHIERRFGMEWGSPGPRFRDYIRALRAIWEAWETRSELDYDGEYYSLDLCPPKFRPDASEEPAVPVFLGGVNEFNLQLAGAIGDGLHLHTFHSPTYVRDEIVPNLEAGAERSGSDPEDVSIVASVFAIPGETPADRAERREEVRRELSFYASTPTYRKVLEAHGWEDIGEELHELSTEDRWDEMAEVVTDEMVDTFSVSGPWDELRDRIEERYDRVDRAWVYTPFRGEDHWAEFLG